MSYTGSALFVFLKNAALFFGKDQTICQSVCEVMIGNERVYQNCKFHDP